jgi:hypothetical protein
VRSTLIGVITISYPRNSTPFSSSIRGRGASSVSISTLRALSMAKCYEPGVTADLLLNPGPVHDKWIKVLYDAAAGLRELRVNGIVVLWRPMHARNAGWWWGVPRTCPERTIAGPGRHMVDYFSNAWGLDNVFYFQCWYFCLSRRLSLRPEPWQYPLCGRLQRGYPRRRSYRGS